MPKAVQKNARVAAASLPYGRALASKKNLRSSSKSTTSKHTSAAAVQKKPSIKRKQLPLRRTSSEDGATNLMSFAWYGKNISEWEVDSPFNDLVIRLSNGGAGTAINVNDLFDKKAAAKSMEGQALLLARSGNYVQADQMQSHANQMKERNRPYLDRYNEVVDAAKQAAVAKQYYMEQKKYLLAGKWDKVLKAAQHLAMLDCNNYPRQRSTSQSCGVAHVETVDLVANSLEGTALEENVNVADAKEDACKEETCVDTADGAQKRSSVFAPKVHKPGPATKQTRKGSSAGKILDKSKQGTPQKQKKDKKNPDIISLRMFNARLEEPVDRNGVHLDNKREEGFVYDAISQKIICVCCDGREVAYATLNQHCVGSRHMQNKIKYALKHKRPN